MTPFAATARRLPLRVAVTALALLALSVVAAPASARVLRPDPEAKAAIVVDALTGEVLLAEGADERHQIASTTKLMTALLALERSNPEDVFRASRYSADPIESQIGLRTGERIRARDLLVALLLESANDAAATIATNLSGSRSAFVRDMNRRARELGLRSTSYSNPIGFDSGRNHSSARDLAALARRLLGNPRFASIVDRPRARLRSGVRRRTVVNRNRLVATHPFVEGVKTGRTLEAGFVLVGAGKGRGTRVVSVILGAPSEAARDTGTLALLRYGLDQFRRRRVLAPGSAVTRVPVEGREGERVALETPRGVVATVRRGRRPSLRVRAPAKVEGPLPAGRRIGVVEVRDRERVLASAPLVTAAAVAKPKPLAALRSAGGAALVLTLLVLAAIVSAVAVSRVRGRHLRRSDRRATAR